MTFYIQKKSLNGWLTIHEYESKSDAEIMMAVCIKHHPDFAWRLVELMLIQYHGYLDNCLEKS